MKLSELGGDIAVEPLRPLAQSLEVLAGVAHADLIGASVLAPGIHRTLPNLHTRRTARFHAEAIHLSTRFKPIPDEEGTETHRGSRGRQS